MRIIIARLLIVVGIVLPGTRSVVLDQPKTADWCQCVVFVLNLTGIEQIPGDYWTASSLAVTDKYGKTWMEYQGYSERLVGDFPQPGDLLILSSGAEVITLQTWSGEEHLVPVAVDSWAGHMGIVEAAENVEYEGKSYWQINLLSANWGVNAKPTGVMGSCYNVDESIFLVPVGDEKSHFFYPTDSGKIRERIVNRARRWAALGVVNNPLATLDGFPVTPLGFISAALIEPGTLPMNPNLISMQTGLVEIPATASLAGDVVVFANPDGIKSYGIIAGDSGSENTEVIVMSEEGGVGFPGLSKKSIEKNLRLEYVSNPSKNLPRFFRSTLMPGYPIIEKSRVSWVQTDEKRVNINFQLNNSGGKTIEMSNIYIQANRVGDPREQPVRSPGVSSISLKAGETYYYSETLVVSENGMYKAAIHYLWNENPVKFTLAGKIEIE